ncbi:MAG: hypothetical protein PHY80_01535 [Rickettsiales bacterium]|nr:hypothetical protein [Rickettsiales bacterium]
METFLEASQIQPKSSYPLDKLTEQSIEQSFLFGKTIIVQTKTGEKHILIKLLASDVYAKQLLDLHEQMMKKLKEDGKSSFLTEKTELDFARLTNLEDGITIGAIDLATGKLIGQTSFSLKNLKGEHCEVFEGTPQVAYNPEILAGFDCIKQFLEIKGTIVQSDYNGGGLSQHLIDFGIAVLKNKFKDDSIVLLAEVAADNKVNLHVRLKDGFKALQKYVASDGVRCYLLYKPLGEELAQKIKFDAAKSIVERPDPAKKSPFCISM